jgi:hypothetical protein
VARDSPQGGGGHEIKPASDKQRRWGYLSLHVQYSHRLLRFENGLIVDLTLVRLTSC